MPGVLENKKLGVRILLFVVVALLGGSMLLYLVPQGPGTGEAASTDTVAKVGDQSVTLAEIQEQMSEIQRGNPIPKQLESLYAQQILKRLVLQREIEYEAKRLGISVSNDEVVDRIRQLLPTAFIGGGPVAMDQYTSQVQQRFQLTVPVFETFVRQGLLEEKFRQLVTDGVSAGPAEIQEEFNYRNQKLKLDYALIKPEDLEAKINPSDADIKAAYEKDRAKYQVPERRVVRYALVDINQLRETVHISDQELQDQYKANIQQYQVPDRVHVEHILFMTIGKTDAEVDEIRKKAEDVLQQVKKGGNFSDLAKKYSEDPGTRDKGGDLGWIVKGQTVAEFEKTAFGLQKGQLSDLVKTQYGFHIIKVLDKETAHTKSFEEVKDSLLTPMRLSAADKEATTTADQLSSTIRQNPRISLDQLAKDHHLTVGETRPLSATDPMIELGNAPEVKEQVFRLHQGDLSLPIKTDRGYVVLLVQQILPAHQGTLEEVRDRVVSDLKLAQATQLAKSKANDLVSRVKSGEKFAAAAKALGLDAKTSDPFARAGSIPGGPSGKMLTAAFQGKQGDVGAPVAMGENWFVYQIAEKQEPNPSDFDKQKKELTDSVLQTKRGTAFDAFQASLDTRLRQEGKLKLYLDRMKVFGTFGQS
ncbi:MAG TPA: peptidyl-prolyl cis-trans isomerase [Candidatus Acidoferrales bacterium]|nr:peptidyl-prolyl cis-trans isomerase [Candidatus Acidoferrales bacterium]